MTSDYGTDAADDERDERRWSGARDYSRRRLDPSRCPLPALHDDRLLCRGPVVCGRCTLCHRPELEVHR